jgi:hypothetical protein
MENTIVKELPVEVQKRIDAIVDSEFDLDIRVFTLAPSKEVMEPVAFFTVWSCSCVTCNGQISTCFTCVCD